MKGFGATAYTPAASRATTKSTLSVLNFTTLYTPLQDAPGPHARGSRNP
jgi:hypothetical protein